MSYELVVFDGDGTLMDSTRVIASSLQAACGDVGAAIPAERYARYVIGLGLSDSLDHTALGLDEPGRGGSPSATATTPSSANEAPLYAGVREMPADCMVAASRGSDGQGALRARPRARVDGLAPGLERRAVPMRDSRSRTRHASC